MGYRSPRSPVSLRLSLHLRCHLLIDTRRRVSLGRQTLPARLIALSANLDLLQHANKFRAGSQFLVTRDIEDDMMLAPELERGEYDDDTLRIGADCQYQV
jgi:hypothetical protein